MKRAQYTPWHQNVSSEYISIDNLSIWGLELGDFLTFGLDYLNPI